MRVYGFAVYAGTFVTVISSRFAATLVSSANGVAEGLHWNDPGGYLEGPKRLDLAAGRQGRCGVGEPLTAVYSCYTVAPLKEIGAVVSVHKYHKYSPASYPPHFLFFFSPEKTCHFFLGSCRGMHEATALCNHETKIRCVGILIATHASRMILCVINFY